MKKEKLILSFYVGMVALGVASLSMSVAWYATSSRLFINSIDISIDADRLLEISLEKDSGYTDHIEQSQFDVKGDFIPLTSAYSSTWISSKADMPLFYDETKFSSLEDADLKTVADHGYFSEKFYLKADDDVYVSVDSSKTYLKANEEYNKTYAHTLYLEYQESGDDYKKSLTEEQIREKLNKIVEAMRFSLLVKDVDEYSYTIIDPHKNNQVTVMGGLLDNDVDQYFDYYQKNNSTELYERVYGENVDKTKLVYDEPASEDSVFVDEDEEPSAFNARHKSGVWTFNLEKSIENGLELKEEVSYALNEFDSNVKPYHFPVYTDKPKEVVVSIYIEGWDLESVNYTMGASFLSNLTFMVEREM